jgi:predicted nucleic acid-binding protein
MIIGLDSFISRVSADPSLRSGCVVDTNILFGAFYDVDRLNTWADRFFNACQTESIPVYTNINIRAEFMDLYRRALIVEGLLMLRTRYRADLSEDLEKRLKALDERVRAGIDKNRTTQLSERDIKQYRKALLSIFSGQSAARDLWETLCRDYLEPELKLAWSKAQTLFGIRFAGSRAIESVMLFSKAPDWDGATEVMGQSGLGSADAMIVNFFACSRFPVLVTADAQVAEHAESMFSSERLIVLPNDNELE